MQESSNLAAAKKEHFLGKLLRDFWVREHQHTFLGGKGAREVNEWGQKMWVCSLYLENIAWPLRSFLSSWLMPIPPLNPCNCARPSAICFSISFDEHILIMLEKLYPAEVLYISLESMNKTWIHYFLGIKVQLELFSFASLQEEVCSTISLSNVRERMINNM